MARTPGAHHVRVPGHTQVRSGAAATAAAAATTATAAAADRHRARFHAGGEFDLIPKVLKVKRYFLLLIRKRHLLGENIFKYSLLFYLTKFQAKGTTNRGLEQIS